MARKKPPSFDFFADDFIAGTYHLEAEAVGIYIRLLCYQWSNGSIPSDELTLSRIAGVDAVAMRTHMPTLCGKLCKNDAGAYFNERLEREREKKLEIIDKAVRSAESRWSKQNTGKPEKPSKKDDANAMRTHMPLHMRTDMPTQCSQLPTSNVLLPKDNTPLPPKGETDQVPPKEKPKRSRTPRETTGEYQIPQRLDTPKVRQALADFEAMRASTKKPIKNRNNICRGWETRFIDEQHVLGCIDVAIANEYQGIQPDYVSVGKQIQAQAKPQRELPPTLKWIPPEQR